MVTNTLTYNSKQYTYLQSKNNTLTYNQYALQNNTLTYKKQYTYLQSNMVTKAEFPRVWAKQIHLLSKTVHLLTI